MGVVSEYLTKTEAAAELGVCTSTLDRRVREGVIPAYKLGSQVVFRQEDVERAKTPKRIEAACL